MTTVQKGLSSSRCQKSAVFRLQTKGYNDTTPAFDLLAHQRGRGIRWLSYGLVRRFPAFSCPASLSPHVFDITEQEETCRESEHISRMTQYVRRGTRALYTPDFRSSISSPGVFSRSLLALIFTESRLQFELAAVALAATFLHTKPDFWLLGTYKTSARLLRARLVSLA